MKDLPRGWMEAEIGELCDLKNGRAFKPGDWTDYGKKIVRIQNLNNPEAQYNHFDGDVRDRFIIQTDDLLFAWSGTPGTSFGAHIWRGGEAVLNQHIFRVDFDRSLLDLKFFKFAINETLDELIAKAHGGVGLRHVTKSKFEETRIPVPPLNEQRRIVEKIEAMFDEIDKGVESLQTARTTLGLYRQSLLKSAFEGRLTADWRAQNADKLEAPETLVMNIERERDEWHEQEFQRWHGEVARWENEGSKGPKPRKPDAHNSSAALTEAERGVLPTLPNEWIYARLNDIAFIGSGMSVSKARKLADPIDTPYLRVANVQRGHLDLTELTRIIHDTCMIGRETMFCARVP
ncbi:type-1 restriction enzyme EcoKI specificity protein [Roseovarius sp. A-2]|uniref:restriction endonuclease subunit S n=1 Tax=Roseovarius sp. A-2 TaxID=1570360 RepID=UPI0009B57315|nr:restriction endonuclease subunit S [Roseovarius sp. A-2]GAW37070.1 type-1 restriction enzyme EcoKI specificity protein [Roseovarius sp. A-2]